VVGGDGRFHHMPEGLQAAIVEDVIEHVRTAAQVTSLVCRVW